MLSSGPLELAHRGTDCEQTHTYLTMYTVLGTINHLGAINNYTYYYYNYLLSLTRLDDSRFISKLKTLSYVHIVTALAGAALTRLRIISK